MKTEIFKNLSSKIEDIDEIKGIVKIAVSGLENIDSDGDIIKRGAWTKTIQENFKRIRHLKDHDRTKAIGIPLELYETNEHLIAVSLLNVKKEFVKDVVSDYIFMSQNGRTIEHSVGFSPIDGKFEKNVDTDGYVFRELKLNEYSTLSYLGANQNTPFFDIKSQEDLNKLETIEKRLSELEQKIIHIFSKPIPSEPQESTQQKSLDINEVISYLKK